VVVEAVFPLKVIVAPVKVGDVVKLYAEPLPCKIAPSAGTPVRPVPPLVTGTDPVWFAELR